VKSQIDILIKGNQNWVKRKNQEDGQFFERISKGQSPKFLWIGCSDSRVPANEITDTESGEIFVHRNIANQVFQNDLNLLAIVQYAVEALGVSDIVICGHYGCGGVRAAIEGAPSLTLVNNWISQIRMSYEDNAQIFSPLTSIEEKTKKLVEVNVMKQVKNLSRVPTIQQYWREKNGPFIHGLVYDLGDGVLKDPTASSNGWWRGHSPPLCPPSI
jgi:carbonic anhydrase